MAFRPPPAKGHLAVLRDAKPLQALINQAHRLDHLQRLVESQLQPAAREHCHVASWREGCLLLIVTDGHWATRLRYQQRRLERQLQALEPFSGLQRILFKVQPRVGVAKMRGHNMVLSSETAAGIHEVAEGIEDPNLRAALERLARHGKG